MNRSIGCALEKTGCTYDSFGLVLNVFAAGSLLSASPVFICYSDSFAVLKLFK